MRIECDLCQELHDQGERCHPGLPRKPPKQPVRAPETPRPAPVEPKPAPGPERRHDCWRCGFAERLPVGDEYWCPHGCGHLRTSWPTAPLSSCYWDQQADIARRELQEDREKRRIERMNRGGHSQHFADWLSRRSNESTNLENFTGFYMERDHNGNPVIY